MIDLTGNVLYCKGKQCYVSIFYDEMNFFFEK